MAVSEAILTKIDFFNGVEVANRLFGPMSGHWIHNMKFSRHLRRAIGAGDQSADRDGGHCEDGRNGCDLLEGLRKDHG